MEENKIVVNEQEENKEEIILNNLKNFLESINNNRQEKERILHYFTAKDYKTKENIKEYFIEKYSLDEKLFNRYIQALQEQANNYLKKTDLLQQDIENLEKQLSENTRKALYKNFLLKVFMPYLLIYDLAQQFSVTMELFEKELKKHTTNYLMQKNLNEQTRKYLENLNKILEKKDEKEKEKEIEKMLLPVVQTAEKETIEYVELLKNKLEEETEKIIKNTNETFLLQHKITAKDLKLDEKQKIEHLENHLAILLADKNKTEDYAIINSINDTIKLKLYENLSFNLLKQVFGNLNKKQFAEIYSYCKQNKINENTSLQDIQQFAKQNKQKVKEIEQKLYKQKLEINFNPKKNIKIIDL